ncbi:MAG: DUF1697 domain-containing protein [Chitinophagaceae bacterium]|nr:DUF1697 domain-containing protein [Chitinophagaceae bacterium]MCB9046763.1 DUF1697 domain-containing protein [Chitinophagales bacterium]
MAKYVAFHRAINVSGTKIIKMEYLRQLFADMGFKNVASYIQSGNVYFEAPKSKNETISKKIEKHLKKELGFEVETMVRTVDELATIADADPYKDIEDDGNAVVYIGFLSEEPEQDKQKLLCSFNNEVDECTVIGTELYILRYKDRGKARFENKFMEGKLKVVCTTRNRKTLYKLLDLYQ